MKAVILSGSSGMRLHPLTAETSPAMVGIFGKPLLEHAIESLKRHDLLDITIVLREGAEQIIGYFGSGAKWGVRLQYMLEDTPLGTAGSLRKVQPLLTETFVVLPGDGITDLDLKAAAEYHRSKSALATIVTDDTQNLWNSSRIQRFEDGRVMRLTEAAPNQKGAPSAIDIGVCILEPEVLHYIPYDTAYDLANHVLPSLLQNQEPFYAWEGEGYWSKIANLGEYRKIHFDALTGKIRLNLCATRVSEGIWIGEDAEVHATAEIRSPFYIGNGVKIGRNSVLGRFAVIGDMSDVGEEAEITHSVLGEASVVGRNAQIYGSILGTGIRVNEGASLADEVVVRGTSECQMKADVGTQLLSEPASVEHAFTWSGAEVAGLARDVAHTRHLAA